MSKSAAKARLEGDRIVVADAAAASRLHGKGLLGDLVEGRLRLRIVEGAWLAAEGKLEVEARGRVLSAADLLAHAGDERREVEFLAYADLRSRGLAVRPWEGQWAVWPRGGAMSAPPEYRVEALSERDSAAATRLLDWAKAGTVLALADEDGAVTYYRASEERPEGQVAPGALTPFAGTVLSDRVVATDAAAVRAARKEHLGVVTPAGLVLSFTEAESLRRRGALDVPATLPIKASAAQPHFRRTLPVYEALRANGVVAKSGFKFGTHLRGYRGDPDAGHAEWLVHCLLSDEAVPWADLARGIRVAHGVRKSFLVAVVGDPVRFVRLAWFKP